MYIESRLDHLHDRMSSIEQKLDEISKRFREWNVLTKRWLTVKETCQLLKCSPRFLQYLRTSGKLGYTKISGKILISVDEIEKMMRDNQPTSSEE